MKSLLLVLALAVVVATTAEAGDVTDTWKKRTEANPGGAVGPVPTVIFLHGCSGAYARPE